MKPDLPIKKGETLLETIVSALFSGLLLALFLKPNLLAIYQRGAKPIPMLVSSSAKALVLGLLLFSLISLAINSVKLFREHRGMHLVWISCISELSGALYFAFFMTRWDALNSEFIRFFRNDLATWAIIAKAAVLCYLLLTLISIADDLYKAYRYKRRA
ncbi:MAG: hypothetical protein EOM68_12455 [Spirochaetia bacterium]|nr:hypothetical protein [Spirochaetia bacterium]